nr:MAG TPA: Cytochrome c/c1 heme lyase [Caudoviricetes sp.]
MRRKNYLAKTACRSILGVHNIKEEAAWQK